MNAVAEIRPKSVTIDMANRYGMEPAAFEATVRATCMKPDKNGKVPTREEFAAFLLVAKEYNLNPMLKEIYAFPAKGGGIVPIVSVDGWVNLINSQEALDGIEFVVDHDDKGALVSITCRIYRKDRSRPIEITEYLSECIRSTEPWAMKHRMLRHKSLIQCARYAFGFAGIYDEDEGEKIATMRDVTPPAPPRPPSPPLAANELKHATIDHDEDGVVIDVDSQLGDIEKDLIDAHSEGDVKRLSAMWESISERDGWSTAQWSSAMLKFDDRRNVIIAAAAENDDTFPGDTNITNSAGRQLHTMEGG